MLILSKNRKSLYNLYTINGLFVGKSNDGAGATIVADITDGCVVMGEYPTEEAAIEELVKIATESDWKSLYEMGQE